MILYIETELSAYLGELTGQEVIGILEKYAISHKIHNHRNGDIDILINEQKICLDEVSMNHLFADAIDPYWLSTYRNRYTLSYGNYGGNGCEFSMGLR